MIAWLNRSPNPVCPTHPLEPLGQNLSQLIGWPGSLALDYPGATAIAIATAIARTSPGVDLFNAA